jgi:hypothetical protein
MLHGIAVGSLAIQKFNIVILMQLHDEVGSPAYINDPSDGTDKHGDSRFVDSCEMACCNQQIAKSEK